MTDTRHPAGHLLQALHDGELDRAVSAELRAHCEHCDACAAELADLARTDRMLAADPTPELPRTVWHRIRADREPRVKPALGLAACAAGIILGVLLGPVQFGADETGAESAWSENLTVWSGSASSSLLSVYQSGSE